MYTIDINGYLAFATNELDKGVLISFDHSNAILDAQFFLKEIIPDYIPFSNSISVRVNNDIADNDSLKNYSGIVHLKHDAENRKFIATMDLGNHEAFVSRYKHWPIELIY